MTSHDWRLVQGDADEQEIYPLAVTADGTPAAFGPLAEQFLTRHWHGRAPVDGRTAGPEQIELARGLEASGAQFHDLDRYFDAFFPATSRRGWIRRRTPRWPVKCAAWAAR
jgi:hypothetical protein